MKSKIIILISILIIISAFVYFNLDKPVSNDILVSPRFGTFKVIVSSTGELQAKNSINIRGPVDAQDIGIYEMTISRIIPEGSIIKQGDFVAELDQTPILNKLKEVDLNITKFESQFKLAVLDSTQTLANARNNLENMKFAMEEAKLNKEQSVYEAPSTQRKAEIEYQRAERNYKQSLADYITQVDKSIANLSVAGSDLSKEKQSLAIIMSILQKFTITAPADGMLIYAKDWSGRKKEVNSTIQPWNPTVATLPDLTQMQSITYINETDIQKVKAKQKVKIILDADPDKKLTGEVLSVANIGEQRKNSDAKVFEVLVNINEKDSTLRPSMTTANNIETLSIDNALFIPLECVHTIIDGENKLTFVYKFDNGKITKQEVKLGAMNDNDVIVEKGLSKSDKVLLNIPDNSENITLNQLSK